MKYFIEDGNTLKAMFAFGSFIEAIDFVNQVADVAEQLNCHPDILIHQGKAVTITTSTHDEVTELDKKLAHQIEGLLDN